MGEGCLQAAVLAPFLGRGHLSETYIISEAAIERSWGRVSPWGPAAESMAKMVASKAACGTGEARGSRG